MLVISNGYKMYKCMDLIYNYCSINNLMIIVVKLQLHVVFLLRFMVIKMCK